MPHCDANHLKRGIDKTKYTVVVPFDAGFDSKVPNFVIGRDTVSRFFYFSKEKFYAVVQKNNSKLGVFNPPGCLQKQSGALAGRVGFLKVVILSRYTTVLAKNYNFYHRQNCPGSIPAKTFIILSVFSQPSEGATHFWNFTE